MLKKNLVKDYWNKRSASQGKATVGYGGHNLKQQDLEYEQKIHFVSSNVAIDEGVTLDYGCGVGRFAKVFKSYVGSDITENLLNIAKDEHPNLTFIRVESPFEIPEIEFDRFFTSTVLQHNDDDSIHQLFKELSKTDVKEIVLYENTEAKAPHCVGRTSKDYLDIIIKYLSVSLASSVSHTVHGQKHTLSVFKVSK